MKPRTLANFNRFVVPLLLWAGSLPGSTEETQADAPRAAT